MIESAKTPRHLLLCGFMVVVTRLGVSGQLEILLGFWIKALMLGVRFGLGLIIE